ncbi:cytidylyltransferase domain-containing protein [Vibrio hepatarius]|uniref:cytidylyltransferase domain-containing protein n=1 Tax=Vibrio hepatarius TaxID=171383 RepID=UPI00142D8CFA|nr:glycosyltransferase family protein [Vibrio hepatarius]NIY83316.1 spore coat protein [Vibrio hepatarius]
MNLVVLQARMSSSRLPGKVLKDICGETLLMHQIRRIKQSKYVDDILVATSVHESDDILEQHCIQNGVNVFRGSLDDVLDRYYNAVLSIQEHREVVNVIRLTADCPFIDSQIIDLVLLNHLIYQNDYTSNTLEYTFPDGLDVEVFTATALRQMWEHASLPSEREHVTLFIKNRPSEFVVQNIALEKSSLEKERWTVDEPADFEFTKSVYEALYPKNEKFHMNEVVHLLDSNDEFRVINSSFVRNEGLIKSLAKDSLCREQKDE